MLRDSDAAVRPCPPRIAVTLAVAWIAAFTAGCGIKGPLRPATPAAPTPAATDAATPAAAEPDSSAPRKP